MSPLFEVTSVPTMRPLVSLTVRELPDPETAATSLLTLVLRKALLSEVTVSTLPAIWPAVALSVMPPWLAFSVTLPVPATMLPLPPMLPVTRLIETSPLFVATFVPMPSRVFDSVTVSALPPPRMLATSVLTFVLRVVESRAVTFSVLPTIWPSEEARVTLPWLAFSATLPVPARMLPVPVILPTTDVMEMSPLFVATFVPMLMLSTSVTVSDWPLPVMFATIVFTLVASTGSFAVTLSTLPVI